MQEQKHIIDCYNKTARKYAEKFIHELSKKHFDQMLLQSFASENKNSGPFIDLGCGPGQTTKYLFDCGITDVIGVDISSEMIAVAKDSNPMLNFEVADMLDIKYPAHSFGAAVAFYSIVHFDYDQIQSAFKEIKRTLINNGQFLFSFHIGDNIAHLDEFLEQKVNIDFHFFETSKILDLVAATDFEIIDTIERQPYPDFEYPSKRAYIWARAK